MEKLKLDHQDSLTETFGISQERFEKLAKELDSWLKKQGKGWFYSQALEFIWNEMEASFSEKVLLTFALGKVIARQELLA